MTETPYFVIYDGMNSIYQFEDLSNKMNSFPFKIKPVYCTDNPNDLKKTYDELGYLPFIACNPNDFQGDEKWFQFASTWDMSWSIGIYFETCSENEFEKYKI